MLLLLCPIQYEMRILPTSSIRYLKDEASLISGVRSGAIYCKAYSTSGNGSGLVITVAHIAARAALVRVFTLPKKFLTYIYWTTLA
jgi:hypothetical protein